MMYVENVTIYVPENYLRAAQLIPDSMYGWPTYYMLSMPANYVEKFKQDFDL